jgi:hypothetical protein
MIWRSLFQALAMREIDSLAANKDGQMATWNVLAYSPIGAIAALVDKRRTMAPINPG